MRESSVLKAIGYWRQGGARWWPRPQWLVQPDWHKDERELIVAYLRSGYKFAQWLGYSYCRFGCGIECHLMGSSDLTDGEWVWPAGLAHYVEAHAVLLPEPLVNTMRWNEWRVPQLDDPLQFGPDPEDSQFDFSYWVDWARRHQRRPWYALW